ncbi:MAG: CvpA family protein [Ferruginibacter sp.]
MIIDVIFLLLMALACYKGLQKGFIIALFSVLGFIIGIAAALKLSAAVAAGISDHTGPAKWLPPVSFLLVFIAVAFAVNIAGRLLQKTFEVIMLGWANRIAGVLVYGLLYSIILSVFLFYAVQLQFIKPATAAGSLAYPYLQPIAPVVIDGFAKIIPWFRDMFGALERFFGNFSGKP